MSCAPNRPAPVRFGAADRSAVPTAIPSQSGRPNIELAAGRLGLEPDLRREVGGGRRRHRLEWGEVAAGGACDPSATDRGRQGCGEAGRRRERAEPPPGVRERNRRFTGAGQALPSRTPTATISAPPRATWSRLVRNETAMKRLRISEIAISSTVTTIPASIKAVCTSAIRNGSE